MPPGMERKGLGDTGHFDVVWMKEGGEGGGEGQLKTQNTTKPLPAGTQSGQSLYLDG